MKLILNGKVIWENPDSIGHFAIKLRKQTYEYELVDQLRSKAKNQFVSLLQRRCETMGEQQIELEADGWKAVADRDQEVEALERALATATAELEDARRIILGKDMVIGELQQRIKEFETKMKRLRLMVAGLKESVALARR